MIKELVLEVNQELFLLNNQRTLFYPKKKILVLSDLHLGKPAHFRRHGIAVSTESTESDIERLKEILTHYQPQKILFIGDLVHAEHNVDFEIFRDFRKFYPKINFILIKGNHDRLKIQDYQYLGLDEVLDYYLSNDLLFIHERQNCKENFQISGHLHPGVNIKLSNKSNLKLPSFISSSKGIILPAYSTFTGLNTKYKEDNFVYIPFTESEIFML